jgi:hypothetical protein
LLWRFPSLQACDIVQSGSLFVFAIPIVVIIILSCCVVRKESDVSEEHIACILRIPSATRRFVVHVTFIDFLVINVSLLSLLFCCVTTFVTYVLLFLLFLYFLLLRSSLLLLLLLWFYNIESSLKLSYPEEHRSA